jgi:hypothetical protein
MTNSARPPQGLQGETNWQEKPPGRGSSFAGLQSSKKKHAWAALCIVLGPFLKPLSGCLDSVVPVVYTNIFRNQIRVMRATLRGHSYRQLAPPSCSVLQWSLTGSPIS